MIASRNLLLLSVGFIFVCTGCLKVKKKDDSPQEQSTSQAPPPEAKEVNIEQDSSDYFKTEIKGTSQAKVYQFKIQLEKNLGLPVRIQRAKGAEVVTTDWDPNQTEWTDDSLFSGEQVRFDLGFIQNGRFQVAKTMMVDVPKDFEFDENLALNQETLNKLQLPLEEQNTIQWNVLRGYERVFFKNQAQISFLDKNLRIETKEIYFHNTILQTFPEGAKAPVGEEGRSGGRLFLKADKIQGEVRIEMRGEDGGDGKPGNPPDIKLKGNDGHHGSPPMYSLSTGPCPEMQVCLGAYEIYTCSTTIPPAGRAENGLRGYRGGDGKKGGNTGRLEIITNDHQEMKLIFLTEVGRGGDPGVGGQGGAPGNPGIAWRPKGEARGCGHPQDGHPGKTGGVGPSGEPGKPGRIETSCYPQDGKMICSNS